MTNVLPHFKRKYQFYVLSVLSGIFVGTTYIPFPAWALAFCYTPIWWAISQAENENLPLKFQFKLAWITQFVLTLIGFNWIYYTAREFGHLHPAVSAGALLLFAAFMHLYIPFSMVMASYLKRRYKLTTTQHIALMALCLALLERIWPSIFQWNLGYTLLWMKWPLYQWADAIGFWGLSSLILIFQAAFLMALINWPKQRRLALSQFSVLLVALGALSALGLQKGSQWTRTDERVSFSLTQANVGNEEKLLSELGDAFQSTIVQKYISQVDLFLNQQKQNDPAFNTDIILWPETAMPLPLDATWMHRPLQNLIQNKVRAWDSFLITGGYSHDRFKKDVVGDVLMRNSVFFMSPDGRNPANYNKSQLLAFGEYLPFGDTFPFLYKLMPFVGTFEKGPGPVTTILNLKNDRSINIGTQICYESLDPDFSRQLAAGGSDIIINVTNDSWFGDWAEPYQHLYMTLARAIEVRRPLVRGTNTGISAAILADGTVLEQSKMDEIWMHKYDIRYHAKAEQTVFTLWGHHNWILLVLGILFILYRNKLPKKTR